MHVAAGHACEYHPCMWLLAVHAIAAHACGCWPCMRLPPMHVAAGHVHGQRGGVRRKWGWMAGGGFLQALCLLPCCARHLQAPLSASSTPCSTLDRPMHKCVTSVHSHFAVHAPNDATKASGAKLEGTYKLGMRTSSVRQ
eukprot:365133-Chlamydomonas_euryale.AAC.3